LVKSHHTSVVLAALVVIALAARLAWDVGTQPAPPLLSDAEYYNATALSLARRQGYAVTFDGEQGFLPGGDATAFWPPGYSLYLGLFYTLFGEDLAVARTANALAGALTVVPVYLIGRRLFGESSALPGAGLVAVLPSPVFWTPVLLSETVFTFLFASAMACMLFAVRANGTFSRRLMAAAGVGLAMATFVRGQALILVPLAAFWWLLNGVRWRPAWVSLALFVFPTAVLLTGWTVRNAYAVDSPVVLSANLGYNLRIGHASYSTGRYVVPQDLWDVEPGITFQERELVFNHVGLSRAIDFAFNHPLDELKLAGRKVMWLWRPDSDALQWVSGYGRSPLPDRWSEPLRWLVDVSYLVLLILAASATLASLRHRSTPFVAALVGSSTAMHIIFFGEPRYHLPLLVLLAPAAGQWSCYLSRRGSLRRHPLLDHNHPP
jgi:4-amino-4-deoxy-L-arabinose transferase-like glycosyltransferase